MGVNAVSSVRHGDEDKKVSYKADAQPKRKLNIGELINGYGSIAVNLPNNFNSAFTVGKARDEAQGAFRG